MKRSVLATGVLMVLALAPLPGHAATKTITVSDDAFTPQAIVAAAGDTITWQLQAGSRNQHEVVTYQGPAYDSQVLVPGAGASMPFGGGTVRYRCKIHGSVDVDGNCHGMCGTITDAPPTLAPPTITSPANGDTVYSRYVNFSGRAAAGMAWVRLKDADTGAVYPLSAVGGTAWQTNSIGFSNGVHHASAQAIDQDGFEGPYSTPIAFTISVPDTTKPTVGISSPNGTTNPRAFTFAGNAKDDVGVVALDITIADALGTTYEPRTLNKDGLGTENVHFYGTVSVMLPGRYTITAVAYDAVGHSATATKDVLVLI